jgi:hypothetical protein
MKTYDVPILLITFNRPDTTNLVLKKISEIKPTKLYVASDGFRSEKIGEKDLVEQCRALVQNVDWDCTVYTKFEESNLGCKLGVSSAIDWFFSYEEEGVILEDDCLPNDSFFIFCREMLNKYRNDKRIMHISGDNFQLPETFTNGYYFSKYCHVWGWATWRRAWKVYDRDCENITFNDISGMFDDDSVKCFWKDIVTKMKGFEIDTWDYQWNLTVIANYGLAVMPNKNLVSNIGFGEVATHTTDSNHELSELYTEEMDFPLVEPSNILPDRQKETAVEKKFFRKKRKKSLIERIRILICTREEC